MSEITKLYKNAGIEKEVIKGCYEYYTENGGIDIYTVNDCKNKDCNTCKADKSIKEYPPFTAEKQIELIKWLVRHRFNFMVFELRDNDFTFEVINKRLKQASQFVSLSGNNFEEGLAKVLNCFWQDLPEEEKQQVKGILK